MERAIFAAAWVSCGYVDTQHMDLHAPGRIQQVVEEAQETLSNLFTPYGKSWSPQRCMAYEWQIEDQRVYVGVFNTCMFPMGRHAY